MSAFSYVLPSGAPPIRRSGATLSQAERKAIADDRRWFIRHKGRTARLRDPAPGEVASIAAAAGVELPASVEGFRLQIAVVVLAKGRRTRSPIWCNIPPDPPDAVIHTILDLIDKADEQGYVGIIGREEIEIALGIELPITKH